MIDLNSARSSSLLHFIRLPEWILSKKFSECLMRSNYVSVKVVAFLDTHLQQALCCSENALLPLLGFDLVHFLESVTREVVSGFSRSSPSQTFVKDRVNC